MAEDFPPQPSSDEGAPESLETRVITGFEGEGTIRSREELADTLERFGFRHYKQGTYKSDAERAYLYLKKGGIYPTEAEARTFLDAVRKLTEHGVLFPETKWGIVKRESGNFHVFAVTRALQQSYAGPQDVWASLPRPLAKVLWERAGVNADDINGEFENPASFIHYIEPGETNHSNNWGWSAERNTFYPIDVEVVMQGGPGDMEASNRRAVAQEIALRAPF